MEKRALDGESRCVHAERRLRELDVQLQEATARCRDAERQRQEQEVLARNTLAAEKQVSRVQAREAPHGANTILLITPLWKAQLLRSVCHISMQA
jgi:hypothetical protein